MATAIWLKLCPTVRELAAVAVTELGYTAPSYPGYLANKLQFFHVKHYVKLFNHRLDYYKLYNLIV